MIYGYARVSTKSQADDGNSLAAQERLLCAAGAEKIYKEAFTGTNSERPELMRLQEQLVSGDKVIVTKLDRLARSVQNGLNIVQSWMDKGITVQILDVGVIDESPTGKLIMTIMLAFAEFERSMIVERTKEGRELARQNPEYREGRKKKFTKAQINHALELLESHSYKQVVQMTGISKSTLIRAKREALQ